MPNESPIAARPKRTPISRLASTFAAITRLRCGVTTKVGRIVPCRNSLVIAITPISAANSAAEVPAESSAYWFSRSTSSRLLGDEAGEQHRQQDQPDHAGEQAEVGAGRAHLAQLGEQLVGHDGSSAVSSRKTSSRLDDSGTSSCSGMPAAKASSPISRAGRALDQQLVAVEQRRPDAVLLPAPCAAGARPERARGHRRRCARSAGRAARR